MKRYNDIFDVFEQHNVHVDCTRGSEDISYACMYGFYNFTASCQSFNFHFFHQKENT